MFGHPIHLFKLFGFSVNIDLSWFIIAILITWSLATGLFPHYFDDLGESTLWMMGVAGALGLFTSIVLHELAHCLIARQYDIKIKGITLFIFGGVAEMADEPSSAKVEFRVAIAGPIASVLIGGSCYLASLLPTSPPAHGVLVYLASMNGLLAAFNLVPAFPLDGGRVLRSAIWAHTGNLRRATRVTSDLGAKFGSGLIILAVVSVLFGNLIGAMWWFLLGMFLRGAARASFQQLLVRNALLGESVSRFMTTNLINVSPDLTIEQLVQDVVYIHHHKLYPILVDGRAEGCITTAQVKTIPRDQWNWRTVREVASSCTPENSIAPDADALDALKQMKESNQSRLLVIESNHLVGVLALKDLLDFLALKIELEGGSE